MRIRLFFVLFLLLAGLSVMAQTGIGTVNPVNKLQVETALANPATSGSGANGNLRLSATGVDQVFDLGLGATYAWLQARNRSDYSTNYNLLLNPNGGNVGIGTTSPTARLNIAGGGIRIHNGFSSSTARPAVNTSSIGNYEIRGVGSITGTTQVDAGDDGFLRLSAGGGTNASGQSSIDLSGFSNNSEMNNNIVMRTLGTERMRINNSGQVGIGTASPGATLEVGSANGITPGFLVLNPTTSGTGEEGAEIVLRPAPRSLSPAAQSWTIDQVSNASVPRLRIFPSTSGEINGVTIRDNGNLGIGWANPQFKLHVSTSDVTGIYVESTASDNNGLMVLNANTSANWANNWHEFMIFQRQGIRVGAIEGSNSGNNVLYNTTSDYRLKTDLKDYAGLELVNRIKTYDYAWKNGGSRMYGVMAHELQQVLPYAVSGTKDAVDKEGKMLIQGVDYGKLTPILVKAIQEQDLQIKEQQKIIQSLIQRLELLEAKK